MKEIGYTIVSTTKSLPKCRKRRDGTNYCISKKKRHRELKKREARSIEGS